MGCGLGASVTLAELVGSNEEINLKMVNDEHAGRLFKLIKEKGPQSR